MAARGAEKPIVVAGEGNGDGDDRDGARYAGLKVAHFENLLQCCELDLNPLWAAQDARAGHPAVQRHLVVQLDPYVKLRDPSA